MLCLLLRIRRQRARVHYATVGARTAKQAGLQFTLHLISSWLMSACGAGPEQGHPLITTRMCVYTYIIVQETLQLPALTGNSFGSCASAHLRASCRGVRTQQRQHVLMACGFSTCMRRASSGNRIAKRRSLRSAAERKHNHVAGEAVQRSKYVRDKKSN